MPRYKGAQFITNPRIKNKYGLENGAFGNHQRSLPEGSGCLFDSSFLVQFGTRPPPTPSSSPLLFSSTTLSLVMWQNPRSRGAAGPKERREGDAQAPLPPSRLREKNLSETILFLEASNVYKVSRNPATSSTIQGDWERRCVTTTKADGAFLGDQRTCFGCLDVYLSGSEVPTQSCPQPSPQTSPQARRSACTWGACT
jgi:hypothetical protein